MVSFSNKLVPESWPLNVVSTVVLQRLVMRESQPGRNLPKKAMDCGKPVVISGAAFGCWLKKWDDPAKRVSLHGKIIMFPLKK